MVTFPILRNAAPPPRGRRAGTSLYPFADLRVGDAFDAADDMGLTSAGVSKRQNTISCAANYWRKANNGAARFTTRRLPEQGIIRCWRMA